MNWQAYHPAWTRHEALRATATRWHRRGLLTDAQQAAIADKYPLLFYRPNVFVRAALFVFTIIGALAGVGFIALTTDGHFVATLAMSTLLGAVALELFIREKKLYHAGPDNALLYLVLAGLIVLWGYAVVEGASRRLGSEAFAPGSAPVLLLLSLPLLLLVAATLRYADRLAASAAFVTLLLMVGNALLSFALGRLLLPFALLLTSAAVYWLADRLARRPDQLYYQRCLTVLRALALLVGYLAVNYLVVREGNALLNEQAVSDQVPLAPLFYALTAGLPLLYIVVGLRRPDRVWLHVGLGITVFSLYTLRHYRSVLPAEVAATLAGSVLIAFSVWATRYLRTPRHGLTSARADDQAPDLNLESLVVAETAPTPEPVAEDFAFGGGQSGGGGATGSY